MVKLLQIERACRSWNWGSLKAFNQALLVKQVWRMIQRPNLLVSNIIKDKYNPNSHLLNTTAQKLDSDSFFCGGFLWDKMLLCPWFMKNVGDGSTIWASKIVGFLEKWLLNPLSLPSLHGFDGWRAHSSEWTLGCNIIKLSLYFCQDDIATIIRSIPIRKSNKYDNCEVCDFF